MKKATFLCAFLSVFATPLAFAQLYQGPDSGSVPFGAIVSTDNFLPSAPFSFPGPIFQEPRNEIEVEPLPPPPGMMRALAPEGSNYQRDPSLTQGVLPSIPPLQLHSFQGVPDLGTVIPPDPYVAAGPDQVITVVNQRFRIWDKSGNLLKTIDAPSWFSNVLQNNGAFDPKILYDPYANRWIMVWLQQSDADTTSHILLSVSDSSSALGTWYNWSLPGGVNGSTVDHTWADYEGVGFDQQAIYFATDQFTFGKTGVFQYMKFRIIPKAQLYGHAAGRVSWTDLWGIRDPASPSTAIFGARPTRVYGNPPEYYFLGIPRFTTNNYFVLYRLTNPLTSPVLTGTSIPVTSWSSPPNAGELGGGAIPIEVGGAYIRNEPVYRDSTIWAVHTIASGTGNAYSSVRYIRINTTTNSDAEDVAFGADGFWTFWPSISVDKDENVAITYSRSGTTQYAGAYMTWRLTGDPMGALRPSVTIQAGKANYVKDFGSGRNRWGDYSGVWTDPVDQNNFWIFTEYAESPANTWGTWVYNARLVPFPGARANSSVASRDFGKHEVGHASDTMSITLTNYGVSMLNVSNISVTQSAYTLLNLPLFPAHLTSLDSLKFAVYFNPSAHGVVNDTITIASNDTLSPALKVPLTAKGILIGIAQAGSMYATSTAPTSQLYTVNSFSGAPSAVGSLGIPEIQGLAIRPSTRELYGAASTTSQTQLYRLSSGFGDALLQATIPLANMRAIAFSDGDRLYGATTAGKIYRIDVTTGDTAFVGTATGLVPSSLAFRPGHGQLWCSVRPAVIGKDKIYMIDTTTGAATLVGSAGLNTQITHIAFGPRGNLYGLIGQSTTTNTLVALDTNTAAGTIIGSMGVTGVLAIVMRNDTVVTGVAATPAATLPTAYALSQNYPNPFNPSTQIAYALPAQSSVRVTIYNVMGQEISRLVDGVEPAGYHTVVWNGANSAGVPVASGIYFYRMEATAVVAQAAGDAGNRFTSVRKMLLLK